jgi:hypothetical protein
VTTREAVGNALSAGLATAGIRGRGNTWRLKGEEVAWVVHLDRLPHGDRVAIDVGCTVDPVANSPRRASDCPIVFHAENMTLRSGLDVVELLDLESSISESTRLADVSRLGETLAQYIGHRQTLAALRAAYAAGEFRSAFISREARESLEAS